MADDELGVVQEAASQAQEIDLLYDCCVLVFIIFFICLVDN